MCHFKVFGTTQSAITCVSGCKGRQKAPAGSAILVSLVLYSFLFSCFSVYFSISFFCDDDQDKQAAGTVETGALSPVLRLLPPRAAAG